MTDDTNRTVRLLAVADRNGFSLGSPGDTWAE
jgi:hypothetical protein